MHTHAREIHKTRTTRSTSYAIEYPRGKHAAGPVIVHRFLSRAERDRWAALGYAEAPGGREAAPAIDRRVRSAINAASAHDLAWPVTV